MFFSFQNNPKNLDPSYKMDLDLLDCFGRVIREVFSFQNNPKNVDPSYKTDLDLWDCFERVKLVLQQNFIGLINLFVVILERGNPVL